ncbi:MULTISPECIES: GAF domain-containing sensor histidine kinase [unclassified Coleofasciculus]|uniref:sensor histidine kinase n=1 Tax=unclassified Coleofasciculus TaxID=2692782 RepID=UPI001D1535F4|nr:MULTISPECIES: GAF domain-containing sensor histidine kinase [unclassified Coleofasciculus]
MQYPAESAQIGQQITQIILTSPNPQTLLMRTARVLGEQFQVDFCLLGAIGNPVTTTQMVLWCSHDSPALLPEQQGQLWQHPLLNTNVPDKEPLAIQDVQASDYWSALGGCWQGLPARAVLKIHTQFQSDVNGVIVLGRQEPHDWMSWEKNLLSVVAESVAVAMSQVQLSRQVLAATRHQTLLNQLSQGMRSGLELDEILQNAIAATARELQVDRGMLLLLNYSNPLFQHQASQLLPPTQVTVAGEWIAENSSEESATSLLNQSFWFSESVLCQYAFRNAPKPIAIADWQFAPIMELASQNLSIFEQAMMAALAIVPLVEAHPSNEPGQVPVLGFLVLQYRQPHSWHDDELELVTWVSTQLSAAILHHQTLRQVQSLVEDRTAQLQQSLTVQAKLYEKTCQQVKQLQELNQLKEEFISTMNHELRTPLTAMSLAIRMLRQPKLPTKRRQKYLEILEEQCNQEIELINDLLSLQQLESNPSQFQVQTIDLIVLIKKLARSFEEKWASKGLTLEVNCPTPSLTINTDPDSLNRILLELLTNAGKYSDVNTTVRLKVTHTVQKPVNQIVLTLTNISPRILPTDLERIFDKFQRGQGVTQQAVQGTGLGLALVKCLVDHLNGTIKVSSYPLKNSSSYTISFTLILPQFYTRDKQPSNYR